MDLENPVVKEDYRPVPDIIDDLEEEIEMLDRIIDALEVSRDELKSEGYLENAEYVSDVIDNLRIDLEDRTYLKNEILRRGTV